MEGEGDRAAQRGRTLDEKINRMRAEIEKDLAEIESQFNSQNNPWMEDFRVLEAMKQTDQNTKTQFLCMYQANKDKLGEIKASILGAMDAMEQDVHRCHAEFEARVGDNGEPSDDSVVMDLSLNLGQYYEMPQFD